MGLSLADYVAFTVALTLASVVLGLVVSTLIVWRRSDDRMALLVALFLVTLSSFNVMFNVSASSSPWQVPNECLSFLFGTLFPLVLALFPTSQFVPRWMCWPVIVFLVVQIPFTFLQGIAALQISAVSLGFLVSISMCAILVVVQWYRYQRISSPLERQQTKWVVFGFAVFVISDFIGIVPDLLFPVTVSPGSLYLPVYSAVEGILILLIPLSFGFAMLRSRLWEIDAIINRALVYGLLTTTVVLVVSTLIVASLAVPLRRHMQALVDRRFYRSKYNAAQVVTRFSATLHNEVDLNQLCEQLLAVVQETMQPAHISLWVRQPERANTPSLHLNTLPAADPRK